MLLFLSMLACGEKDITDTSVAEPSGEPSTEETDTEDTSDTEQTDTQEDLDDAESIRIGDIVITEIMKNPCGVTGMGPELDGNGNEYLKIECTDPQIADDAGEWFEVYNASARDINLNGLMVHELDDGNGDTEEETFLVTEDVVVAAGEYAVFGVSADTTLNGGVDVDVVYDHGSFSLKNGADSIALSNSMELLDVVSFNDDEYPDLKGHSLTLDPSTVSETDNDTGSNWCPGSSTMPSGDLGTPGAANDACE